MVVCSLALAAPVAAQDDAEARRHFETGTSYFTEGNYESALREFDESYRLSGRPGLLYNIALCHERLGNLGEAAEHLERFLSLVEDVDGRDALERRLANLRERQRRREAERDPQPTARPPDTVGGGVPLAAWVAFAAAGVGAVTWGVFGTLAFLEHGSLEDECKITRTCTEDDVSSLETYSLVADVGMAVTVAGAVTGLVLLAVGGGSEPAEAPVSVAPWAGSRAAGLSVAGAL
jgi:hypothetical protein